MEILCTLANSIKALSTEKYLKFVIRCDTITSSLERESFDEYRNLLMTSMYRNTFIENHDLVDTTFTFTCGLCNEYTITLSRESTDHYNPEFSMFVISKITDLCNRKDLYVATRGEDSYIPCFKPREMELIAMLYYEELLRIEIAKLNVTN